MTDHTRTESQQQLVGSIHYIAPEVIQQTDAYSQSSDLYALGLVLYELLTGRRAFVGTTIAEVLQRIGRSEFQMPREINPKIPRDLEAICLRAMEFLPKDRYLSAKLFADDLDRYLNHQPVLARHPGVLGLASRWLRRNPAKTAGLLTAAIAVLVFIGFIMASNQRLAAVNAALTDSNQQLAKALESSQKALFHNEQLAYCDAITTVANRIEDQRARDARSVLNIYGDGTGLAKHRDFDWYFLQNQIERPSHLVYQSPKPLYYAEILDSQIITCGADSRIAIIDGNSHQLLRRWDTRQGEVNGFSIDKLNRILYSSGDDGTIVASSLETGTENWRYKVFDDQRAYGIFFSAEMLVFIVSATWELWLP